MRDKGFIFDIKKYSVNDGPGIRTTVFFKGCPLDCWWCHNPESREMKPAAVKGNSYSWSIYSQSCSPDIIGKETTSAEVFDEIIKDMPFYEESGGGVTFSGGEPLLQSEFLTSLLSLCKEKGIHTAVDTSGYAKFSILESIYDITDLFLFDIKILDDELHKKYTGVSNKIILENLTKLSCEGNKVIVRIPVIPSVNDNDDNISKIVEYLSPLNILEINLIPFHNSAISKYNKMKIKNRLQHLAPLSGDEMERLKERFTAAGKNVKVGG